MTGARPPSPFSLVGAVYQCIYCTWYRPGDGCLVCPLQSKCPSVANSQSLLGHQDSIYDLVYRLTLSGHSVYTATMLADPSQGLGSLDGPDGESLTRMVLRRPTSSVAAAVIRPGDKCLHPQRIEPKREENGDRRQSLGSSSGSRAVRHAVDWTV